MEVRREKSFKILSFFLKKDIKSMSIFTFRKIMLKKIYPLFWIFNNFANALPYML